MKTVAYIRVSTDEQDTARQYTSVRKYAETKRVTIDRYYEDHGRRHEAQDRPKFREMMRAVQNGEIARIIVDAQDRLGFQGIAEFFSYVFIFQKHRCELIQAIDGKVLTDEEGAASWITAGIGAHGSKEEMVKKATRDLGAKTELARRGIWTGGWVPFGCDVVCRTAAGQERWRVVVDGKWKRYRLWPDGRKERWDGKGEGAFPRDRQAGDSLILAASVITQRHEVLRAMFEHLEAGWPLNRVARRLDEMGEEYMHPHGPWYSVLVKKIAQNPACIGLPAYNKNAHGLYSEWVDGQARPNPPRHDKDPMKPKTGRRRERSAWIMPPEPIFPPIVQPDLFWRVQERLDQPAPDRKGRSEKLWLNGLTYCGTCQTRMVGWHYNGVDSYACATYRKYGRDNKFGCKHHSVRQDALEAHLDKYLNDLGVALNDLVHAGESQLISTIYKENARDQHRLQDLRAQMEHHLIEALKDVIEPEPTTDDRNRFRIQTDTRDPIDLVLPTRSWEKVDYEELIHLYSWITASKRTRRAERIQELTSELERSMLKWDQFDAMPTARRMLEARMGEIEDELARLRADNVDLGAQVKEVLASLQERVERLEKLRVEREKGTHYAKAEALRNVLDRIVLWYEYRQHGQQLRSILSRVDFEPLEGGMESVAQVAQRVAHAKAQARAHQARAKDFRPETSPGPG